LERDGEARASQRQAATVPKPFIFDTHFTSPSGINVPPFARRRFDTERYPGQFDPRKRDSMQSRSLTDE
jgi:hypothetical protein